MAHDNKELEYIRMDALFLAGRLLSESKFVSWTEKQDVQLAVARRFVEFVVDGN